jgi:hypothetical protein
MKIRHNWIKRLVIGILPFYLFTSLPLHAQMGTWKNYLSYHDVQKIEDAGSDLFVCASNSLYQYNMNDHSIVTYDRSNGMSDTGISFIKWCQQAKRLIAIYSNGNIDLVDLKGNVVNVSDIYQKAITGNRNINDIYIYGQYAYISCGFGIVKLNVKDAEISESYMLNLNVAGVIVKNNYLYAKIRDTYVFYYIRALLSSNMIDVNNWKLTGDNYANEFEPDSTTYNKYYETVSKLNPGGPKYNYFNKLKVFNNKLYTVGGGWYQFANYDRPGTIQVLDGNDNWQIYEDDFQLAFASNYLNVNDITVDPNNPNHVMAASCSGILEFMDGKFQNNYTDGNTQYITSATGDGNPDYVRTDGIAYDSKGNLYVLNSGSNYAILKRSTSGEWSGFINESLMDKPNKSMRTLKGTIFDSKGRMWFCNAHNSKPALICYDTETQKVVLYNTFINQDGSDITPTWVLCVCEDLSGNIWIGTDIGPFYLTADEQADPTKGFIQHKVPRNDGTNYADYLLAGLQINSIVVDKAGRKWLATEGNGVYLISEDNNTQERQFTTSNSYLLSNLVESMAINNETGVVYFGTDKGLCSYVSDATNTNEEMTTDNVWAYPNPVTPEYTGLITITGLSYQSDVKILNASGKLIAQGRSNGGTFTWNGCDESGNRVGSGVYMVATTKSDGSKGTVCKIAIVR